MTGQDVFKPLATGGIPSNIKPRNDHPVSNSKIVRSTAEHDIIADIKRQIHPAPLRPTSSMLDYFSESKMALLFPNRTV